MITKANEFDLNIRWRFPGGRKYAFAFIALFVFLLVIYANSFKGDFQFDDQINIVENRNIFLESLNWPDIKNTFYGIEGRRIDRPLAFLSFALNYYFHKLDVFWYHVVNFKIHYLASLFLFIFIYRTLNLPLLRERYGHISYSVALLATIFWATSPVQITAVTYIVQRMASMAGLFYIMAMYFYLKGRTAERTWKIVVFWSLCVLSAVLSFGSKENAVLIPMSIWMYDLLLIQGVNRENVIRNLKVLAPVILIVAAVGLWYVDVASLLSGAAYKGRPFTLSERLLTEPRIVIFYITLLLYPISSRLTLIHDIELSTSLFTPWTTLPAIVLILVFVLAAVYMSCKRPFIAFCVLFFFINHTVESTFIPLELIYEHRNYIPSMFFFAPIVLFILYVIDYFSYKKKLQWTMVAVFTFLMAAQGHTVYLRNTLFEHPLLLWTDNLKKTPALSRVYNNLGAAYWDLGYYDNAYASYAKAESLDRQINSFNRGVNLHNLGMYYFGVKSDYQLALSYFEKAIQEYPGYWRAYHDAALCDIRMGNLSRAGNRLSKAISLWPEIVNFRESLALVLLKVGEYDEAIREALSALFYNPNLCKPMTVLAEAHHRKGNERLATLYWERVLEKCPRNIEGNLALLEFYYKQHQKKKFLATFNKVMCLKGTKSWDTFIKEYLQRESESAYTPSSPQLTLLLQDYIESDFKK